MRSRWFAALAFAAAATLALGGCAAPDQSNTDGSSDSGELVLVYNGDASNQKLFNSLAAEFSKQYPDIELKAVGIPSATWADYCNTVATRLAGGEKFDIILVATEGQRLFASKDVLSDLTPFIEEDQAYVDEYWGDISPRLKEFSDKFSSGPNGEPFFMPGGFNTMTMYLNKKVFEEAGVPIPADGNWTWDDFAAAGKQIKDRTGAYMTPAPTGYFTGVMPWLTTNGASTFSDDWSKSTFGSDAAVESAEFARMLIADGLAPEPGGQFDPNAAFSQGKLAVIPGGRWPTPAIRDMGLTDDTVIVNWPTKTQNGSPVGWDASSITKTSENKEAAWSFVKFMMSKEAGQFYASIGGTIVPARVSVANSSYFTDDAPEGTTRLSEAMDYATPIPSIDKGAEAQTVIEEAWLTILTGQGDARETLEAAQASLDSLNAP